MKRKQPKYERYQDYVIKDGRLVGEFEEMYRDHEDPWHQVDLNAQELEKRLGLMVVEQMRDRLATSRILEIGCGLGHYTQRFCDAGFEACGWDISSTAIEAARRDHPDCRFEVRALSDHAAIKAYDPAAIVLSEITWYVLDDLAAFLAFLRRDMPDTVVFHMLSTYPEGVQTYGQDFFTNHDEILTYFDMCYAQSGTVRYGKDVEISWFIGDNSGQLLKSGEA